VKFPPRITATPGRCNGKPRIKGTRITTKEIGLLFFDQGHGVRLISYMFDLCVADVEDALRFELPRIRKRNLARIRRDFA
jgi:uncharacterized protein (DUF433 family)